MQKFVLIGGMGRSGTNLLRRIVGSHSKIAIPPTESKFFSQCRLGGSVPEILANEKLKPWNMDFMPFYGLSHAAAFRGALGCYAESLGKEIPGEKSPLNEFHYDLIEQWLEDHYAIRFLQLVRNPLDVIASHKHAPFRRDERGTLADLPSKCGRWLRSVSLGLARGYAYPQNYRVVKYEDLTADPVGITRELCDFVGVAFEEARMLNQSDYAGRVVNTSFAQSDGTRHAEYTAIRQPESRKRHLTDEERAVIASHCGELADALGYVDEDLEAANRL